jgi:hypothetical protein
VVEHCALVPGGAQRREHVAVEAVVTGVPPARTSRTAKRKNTGFTPATPASPKDMFSMPPKNAASPVNRPRISAKPITASPIAMIGASHPPSVER